MHAVAAPPHSETHDFYMVVHALAYDEADFDVRPVRWSPTKGSAQVTYDLMIVKRKSNGVRKAYAIDPNENGMFSFFDDLFAGEFGEN